MIGLTLQKKDLYLIGGGHSHIADPFKKIYCYQHPSLRYDLLSINIDSQPALNNIQGALEHGYPIKPIKQFMQNWQQ